MSNLKSLGQAALSAAVISIVVLLVAFVAFSPLYPFIAWGLGWIAYEGAVLAALSILTTVVALT